jgi:crotonobetainyl-CoA:carnitine CoA-transferase CaiB-like acyl-CoA transferase
MADLEGALTGVRVVELASDHAAFAGKLLADLGAEVILVEPPGGHPSRGYGPFVDDRPDPEGSLWWWHYHTSKLGVVLDLEDGDDADRFRRLVEHADIVVEGETPGRLAALGLDFADLRVGHDALVWVSVTAFGRDNSRRNEEFTDLTLLAGGGPVWSCGYDDHSLPPVRGLGNQGYQIGSVWAAIGALTAYLARDVTGAGQLVDVSLHAAANVTTESATQAWLVAGEEVHRLTCRHAGRAGLVSMETLALTGDEKWLNTGVPPRTPREFAALAQWLEELGLHDEFPGAVFLDMGAEREAIAFGDIGVDPIVTEIVGAGREAMMFIASKLTADDFFTGGQQRGLTCGPIYAPEEIMASEHIEAREFPTPVFHEDLGREVVYPGAPFKMSASPWRISRRAPRVGEHQHVVSAVESPST